MKKLKKVGKVSVIVIVILIFVMSYVDFGVRNQPPADVSTPIVKGPTSSPSVAGPTTPPPDYPSAPSPKYPIKRPPTDLEFLLGNSSTT